MTLTQGFIIALMNTLVFVAGGISVLNGHTTIGHLSVVMIYFNQVLGNITYYLQLAKKYQIFNSAIYRMEELSSDWKKRYP